MTTITQAREFGAEFLDRVIDWIVSTMDPGDVFPDDKLQDWATDNGYIKVSDCPEYSEEE